MESTGRATRQVPESEAARKKASQISGRLESWKKILCYDDSDLVSTGWNLSGVGKKARARNSHTNQKSPVAMKNI